MDEVHLPAGHVLRCALGYELDRWEEEDAI